MSLVSGSMRRPVTVTMLTLAAIVFGFVSLGRLPLNLLPDISYPTLTIRTEYADAAPAEVEKLITEPLEDAVAVVRGLRGLRSVSRPGVSEITLEFGWKTDMDYAGIDVREKIDLVNLPDDVESPTLLRFDPSLDPILRLGVHGDEDPVTLRHLAEHVLKKDLESLIGVASVRVQGGLEEEVQVEVDEGKLAALGIPISTVSQFLQQQNLNSAGGRLRDRDSEFLVRTLNEFEQLDDLAQTVLYEENGRRVLLEDVATIRRGHKEREVLSKVRGDDAVELSVFKEGDANTVQVARAVKRRLGHLREELPQGVELQVLADQSTFIEQSINEVRNNALVGGLLAVFVLFLFLKQSRPTFIIGLTIPISIMATFFVMQQLHVSLNIMSLGGLALGVGMLVDNAIVVLEAIQRHRSAGASIWDSTRTGASEVSRAVTASTLTSVAVFLPIIFVEGIAGQIFRDQALTVTASLLVSLLAAITLIPMLSSIGNRPAELRLGALVDSGGGDSTDDSGAASTADRTTFSGTFGAGTTGDPEKLPAGPLAGDAWVPAPPASSARCSPCSRSRCAGSVVESECSYPGWSSASAASSTAGVAAD
ncbi:MAG: efflux RND transporter permease subunit [Candidatus Eisenbacteria bacterium]